MAALPCAWPAGLANKCLSAEVLVQQRPSFQRHCRAGAVKVMAASEIPMRRVGNLEVPAILIGMWQVSGGHGQIDRNRAVAEMFKYVDAGFTCFDMADHYGPAEDLYGEFRRQYADKNGEGALANVHGLTKWVPPPGDMSLPVVEKNIDISRRRMGVKSLDMLQFHWWDYNDRRYLDAMKSLAQLQQSGKIQLVSLTNFDTVHVKRIGEAGVKLASNQVSYSIVDTRPEKRMVEYCLQNDIQLLCYGTLLGGLLSDRWLGQPEPLTRRELSTSSLGKYKRFVDQWGSWSLFQELLQVLRQVADKHGVSIANVAVRWVVDRPAVGAAIVGARLSIAEHVADNKRALTFAGLDAEDLAAIEAVQRKGRMLPGDCGDEYRF